MRRMISTILFATTLAFATGASAAPYLGGFVEGAQVFRIDENAAIDGALGFGDRAYSRSEMRAQFTATDGLGDAEFFLRLDLLSDETLTTRDRVSVDLREAYIKLFPARWIELKLGRQVATWGTGDFVFANDLFAKDWQAFFTGLDDAYLKPPQDLARVSLFFGGKTMEIALSPRFTADNLPDGSRLSVFNPFLGAAGADGEMPDVISPERNLSHGEVFARLFGAAGSFEWALYGYRGYWPTPQAVEVVDPNAGQFALYHPRMDSFGTSLRGPVGSFLANAELAAYFSRDDSDGTSPMIPNSELRMILGLEKSLGNDWSIGGQYYGIRMMDYAGYEAGLQQGAPVFDELRSTVTARINKFALDQNLQLSLFAFVGLTDGDWHIRPTVAWKITDAVKWTVGGSLIGADDPWTNFGQFENNGSLFTRIRYSF